MARRQIGTTLPMDESICIPAVNGASIGGKYLRKPRTSGTIIGKDGKPRSTTVTVRTMDGTIKGHMRADGKRRPPRVDRIEVKSTTVERIEFKNRLLVKAGYIGNNE